MRYSKIPYEEEKGRPEPDFSQRSATVKTISPTRISITSNNIHKIRNRSPDKKRSKSKDKENYGVLKRKVNENSVGASRKPSTSGLTKTSSRRTARKSTSADKGKHKSIKRQQMSPIPRPLANYDSDEDDDEVNPLSYDEKRELAINISKLPSKYFY